MGRAHQALQRPEQAVRGRYILGRDQRRLGLWRPRALIDRRRVRQRRERDVGLHGAAMAHHELAGVSGAPDHREIELPFTKHALGDRLGAWLQHHEHALLALRQHHLIGGHAGLARRHPVKVELDADAAFVRHLHRGRGESRRAHILDGDDGVLLHQLEAGFEQQLLGEGIAHLHRRALLGRSLVELCRGHGGAVNAVAPGLRADIDHGQAHALRRRLEDALGIDEPHGHGVDQDVVVVARVEIGLAADGGDAHAIAVVADARHDAGNEVPGLGVVWCAEAERIHVGDGRAPMVNTSRMMPPTPVAAP